MTKLIAVVLGLLAFLPGAAPAWWNAEWTHRRPIVIDTTPAGADLKEGLASFVVPVRLHTGNFAFLEAKEDGADLRVVAADDKTPLKFHIEKYDSVNELAILWVQVPSVPAAVKAPPLWLYWGNGKAQPVADSKSTYDPTHIAVYHFGEREGAPADATAYGLNAGKVSGVRPAADGPIGSALSFDGSGSVALGPAPALKVAPGAGFTFSAWVRPAQAQRATLFVLQQDGASISIALEDAQVVARVTGKTNAEVKGGEIAAGRWSHLAVAFSDRVVLYVDGREVAAGAAALPAIAGEARLGADIDGASGAYAGDLDEVQLASVARSAGWVRAAWAAQTQDGKLLAFGEAEGASGGSSYLGILLEAVTLDGWIVIGILMVMMLVSFAIMIGKALMLSRTSRANEAFRDEFANLAAALSLPASAAGGASAAATDGAARSGVDRTTETDREQGRWRDSSLFRVYRVAVDQLEQRFAAFEATGAQPSLSPQALGAIKASIDAGMVRENERLNNQMVLLTIAISGGPFLGLLGTVVGVMITFAAIAAAGDVNVNAIAPGIAAALVATVAGLAVAIPALFGYNYFASRIKSISNDMAVFSDELVARLAEIYAP